MQNHITLTDENFGREVHQSDKPVLVDFWAPWCMPCQMLAPVIEEIAVEFSDKIKVGKLNTDENINTATEYQIRGIPSLLIYKDSKVADRIVGVVPKENIVQILNRFVSEN